MVGSKTTLAAPPATLWDCHDTVGMGTGEGTHTRPVLGVQFGHKNQGPLQPAELSSDTHIHPTQTHTHTHICFPR